MTESTPLRAIIDTNKGTIKVDLFHEETPVTVANFFNLASRGYYNDLKFHRVILDFMVQGGCPQGTGTGGPGYNFENECSPALRHDKPGTLSMANAGPGTNGSQFFITHVPTDWLDGKHTVFGAVAGADDQEVVDSIRQNDRIKTITIEGDAAGLIEKNKSRIEEWNKILDGN